MERVVADFQGRAYPILIQPNVLSDPFLPEMEEMLKERRWVLITDDHVSTALASLVETLKGYTYLKIEIQPGEKSKNFRQVEEIMEMMAEAGINRYDGIIALGGGVVGDLAGFCASIYMRGISWIQIPTTLLSQVDSSVGGKTGVNLEAGKNLVGSFYQPQAVWIDPFVLWTLPNKEYWGGCAEVIKYAIIQGSEMSGWIRENWQDVMHKKPDVMTQLIKRCIACKNTIVMADEREKGLRKVLNFGHTAGHAREKLSNYTISHGEAVRWGMLYELELACRLHWILPEKCSEYKELVHLIPVEDENENFSGEVFMKAMASDKKNRDNRISFVLPKEPDLMEEILLSPKEIQRLMT